jgi:hypothetical protein
LLFQTAAGRAFCSAAQYFISFASGKVSQALNSRCRQFYSTRIFHAVARLDVPTWDDPAVTAHINALFTTGSHRTNTWDTIATLVYTGSAFLRVLSQAAVMFGVLRGQKDGLLLALSSFSSDLLTYFDMSNSDLLGGGRSFFTRADPRWMMTSAWAATTRNQDYIRMEGLKSLIHNSKHRKEFVAGGLAEYLIAGMSNARKDGFSHWAIFTEYHTLSDRVGKHATDFWTSYFDTWVDGVFRPLRLLNLPLSELPEVGLHRYIFIQSDLKLLQVIFALRAAHQPSSIPISLASLHLIRGASGMFMMNIRIVLEQSKNFSEQLSALRKLFEAGNISNKIVDGTTPYPENEQSLRYGISLEFRYSPSVLCK